MAVCGLCRGAVSAADAIVVTRGEHTTAYCAELIPGTEDSCWTQHVVRLGNAVRSRRVVANRRRPLAGRPQARDTAEQRALEFLAPR